MWSGIGKCLSGLRETVGANSSPVVYATFSTTNQTDTPPSFLASHNAACIITADVIHVRAIGIYYS